jgi:hypothetical protein
LSALVLDSCGNHSKLNLIWFLNKPRKKRKGIQIPNSFLGLIHQRAHFLFSSSLLFFFHVSPLAGLAPAHLGPAAQRCQHPGQSPRRNEEFVSILGSYPLSKNLPGSHDLISTYG